MVVVVVERMVTMFKCFILSRVLHSHTHIAEEKRPTKTFKEEKKWPVDCCILQEVQSNFKGTRSEFFSYFSNSVQDKLNKKE